MFKYKLYRTTTVNINGTEILGLVEIESYVPDFDTPEDAFKYVKNNDDLHWTHCTVIPKVYHNEYYE